ncbi:hypothetical protein [Coleofasciculus sp.]
MARLCVPWRVFVVGKKGLDMRLDGLPKLNPNDSPLSTQFKH